MKYTEIAAAVALGEHARWNENECAAERVVQFDVYVGQWAGAMGRNVVKVRLPNVAEWGDSEGYVGVATFDPAADGEFGYRRARVAALVEAYGLRHAVEC